MKLSLPMLGAGLAVVALLVLGGLYSNKDSHVEAVGGIQKVRVGEVEEKASVAILDFRITNPSAYPYVVRTVDLILEDKDGKQTEGRVIADRDAKRLLDALPLLGPKFNETLMVREKIAPRQTVDRMISARFEGPKAALEERKRFLVRILEVDGKLDELAEKR